MTASSRLREMVGHVGLLPDLHKDWCGWAPKTVEQKIKLMRTVMETDGHGVDENLTTNQKKNIEFDASNVAHCTEAERKIQRTPDDVRTREEAAARCTNVIKRRELKKQAREARAEHLVRCFLAPGKKKASKKPLSEFYVDRHFTEDGEEWQKKPQRRCEEM